MFSFNKVLFPLFLFFYMPAFAQEDINLSLDEVMNLAEERSLEALSARNAFLASYWDFRYYKAGKLPILSLQLNPIEYYNTTTKRYDIENNIELYKEQKIINSYAGLSLSQNLPFSGGSISLNSDLSRLVNFGDNYLVNYNATLVSIAYTQPLFGFNKFKWQNKTDPLEYEVAQKEYLQQMQHIKLKAFDLYFELLLAGARYETALQNYAAADTLHKIGEKKFDILSARYQDVLELERNKLMAESEIIKSQQEIQQANSQLISFLNYDKQVTIRPEIPGILPDISIDAEDVLQKSYANNSLPVQEKLKIMQAEMQYEKSVRENRFSANLIAGYGLNQYADNLADAYRDPLPQEIVTIGMSIPITDWGKGEGAKQVALNRWEEAKTEAKKNERDFEQNIRLTVSKFNIQNRLVNNARRVYEISKLTAKQTQKKYMSGNADILELNTAFENRQRAYESYIESIRLLRRKYYEITSISLYDYIENKPLSSDFNRLHKQ